eukprot:360531-Chlamydomonas_euryale.AAC.2
MPHRRTAASASPPAYAAAPSAGRTAVRADGRRPPAATAGVAACGRAAPTRRDLRQEAFTRMRRRHTMPRRRVRCCTGHAVAIPARAVAVAAVVAVAAAIAAAVTVAIAVAMTAAVAVPMAIAMAAITTMPTRQ